MEWPARWIGLGALGAAPLAWWVVHPAFFHPFVVPKALWLRACAWLLVAAGAWAWASGRSLRREGVTRVDAAVAAFLAVSALTAATGVDPRRSLWDTSERMAGVVTLAHLALLYAAWAIALANARARRRLLGTWVAVGAVVAGLGVAQNLDPSYALQATDGRATGTFGHPLHLAHAALFTIFAAGLLADHERRRWARALAAGAGLLALASLIVSETRGSLLGLAAGVAVAGTVGGTWRHRPRLVLGLTAAGASLLFAARAGVPFLAELPVLRRLGEFDPGDGTAATRLVAWSTSLDAAQARPLLGWGPRSFSFAAAEHRDPSFAEIMGDAPWWDAPHNAFIEALVGGGLPGLAAYVALFAVAAWLLRRAPGTRERAWLAGFLAAHAVHVCFAFESVTSWPAFLFVLAWVSATTRKTPVVHARAGFAGPRAWLAAAGLALALAGAWAFVVAPARRSVETVDAFDALVRLSPATRARVDARLDHGDPHVGEAALLLSDGLRGTLGPWVRHGRSEEARALARRIDGALARYAELHPRDVRIPWSRAGLALDVARTWGDHEALADAEPGLAAAVARAPHLPPLRERLARLRAAERSVAD